MSGHLQTPSKYMVLLDSHSLTMLWDFHYGVEYVLTTGSCHGYNE